MSAKFIEVGEWTLRADRVQGWAANGKGVIFRIDGISYHAPDVSAENFGKTMRAALPDMFGRAS